MKSQLKSQSFRIVVAAVLALAPTVAFAHTPTVAHDHTPVVHTHASGACSDCQRPSLVSDSKSGNRLDLLNGRSCHLRRLYFYSGRLMRIDPFTLSTP